MKSTILIATITSWCAVLASCAGSSASAREPTTVHPVTPPASVHHSSGQSAIGESSAEVKQTPSEPSAEEEAKKHDDAADSHPEADDSQSSESFDDNTYEDDDSGYWEDEGSPDDSDLPPDQGPDQGYDSDDT